MGVGLDVCEDEGVAVPVRDCELLGVPERVAELLGVDVARAVPALVGDRVPELLEVPVALTVAEGLRVPDGEPVDERVGVAV